VPHELNYAVVKEQRPLFDIKMHGLFAHIRALESGL
jgi:hypothetical protein